LKLIDTTIAVDHLRGDELATTMLERLITDGEIVIASELMRFELLAGVRNKEIQALESFFDVIGWIPVSEEISRTAGQLARKYRKSHSGIDDVDYLIAATTLSLNADLLTTNIRHFPMLKGIKPPY
jgi:predicted nucleic acid-binding protein